MRNENVIVNIISFIASLVSFFSAVIVWLVLPSGQGFQGGRGEIENNLFLGLVRHDWMNIHTVSSLIFMGFIVVHLILHWQWIKTLPKTIKE